MPVVSVIIPLHNKGPYVTETLESLQSQALAEWEAIVVENNSVDDGPTVVAEMAKMDCRIRLIIAPDHVCGPCGARNLGLEHAGGKWILFLDADDWIEADHLSILCEEGNRSSADVVAGGWKEFEEGNASVKVERNGPRIGETAESVLERSLAAAPWAVHSAIVSRAWLKHEIRWPDEMERLPSEDSVFWFRVLQGCRLAVTASKCAMYRKETMGHRDCYQDVKTWTAAVLTVINLNQEWLGRIGKQPSQTQAAHVVRMLEHLGRQCFKIYETQMAKRVMREAELWLTRTSFWAPGLLLRRVMGVNVFNTIRIYLQLGKLKETERD